ncbi:helix-turn-helix domain-containing protein [Streptomyces sp. NPDC018610]|uniref:helix-turn-helix domain-containing protein n=1 Tax=Streptomyces sp. NPDC018610 TaxID=3365049 RepID=UPI00378B692B
MSGDDFAQLLGELKERSGLSYGALGKRLHMSASTVHRYVNGDVVPTEFAPVERLARICRATPDELLELHRRWIRADALRGTKAAGGGAAAGGRPGTEPAPEPRQAPEPASEPEAEPEAASVTESASDARPPSDSGPEPGVRPEPVGESRPSSAAEAERNRGAASEAERNPGAASEAERGREAGPGSGRESAARPEPARTPVPAPSPAPAVRAASPVGSPAASRPGGAARRRSAALLAGAGVVAVAAATVLVVNLVPGHSDGAGTVQRAAETGSAAAPVPHADRSPGPTASTSPSLSPSPSSSPSRTPTVTPSRTASLGGAGVTGSSGGADAAGSGPAITVATTPYYWDVPCEQSFLVDRSPQNVPTPPPQQNVVGWSTALGAVAADHQMLALTVQGTGAKTVVLQALHVRVVRSDAPLTWNKYAMGVGCGGGVDTKSFDVQLDLTNPLVQPIGGQRNFPYKVSESDPEVFYVDGHTSGHDVSWYLELDWSSGDRHGTVRVDDHGKPFRTSGSHKAYYAYPLGGKDWEPVSGE